jgi:hypothetical protein
MCVKCNRTHLTFDVCVVPSTGITSHKHTHVRTSARCNFNLTVMTLSLEMFILLRITGWSVVIDWKSRSVFGHARI